MDWTHSTLNVEEANHARDLHTHGVVGELVQKVLGCGQHSAELHSPYAHFVASQLKRLKAFDLTSPSCVKVGHICASMWELMFDAQKAAFASHSCDDEDEETGVPRPYRDTTDAVNTCTETEGETVSTAAVVQKLNSFLNDCMHRMHDRNQYWVDGELIGNPDAITAAAERGDVDAQYAAGLFFAFASITDKGNNPPLADHKRLIQTTRTIYTKLAIDHGSDEAQHIMGLLDCLQYGYSRSKTDMLKTARWFRMAAHQGLKEAQWELGEMFRTGRFCNVHMRFARKYIRRASRQGHAEALERMTEQRQCVYCGAKDAPFRCSRCHEARCCDSICSGQHWSKGDGCVGYSALHSKTCARTHMDGYAGCEEKYD